MGYTRRIEINAPPERVFEAWTHADQLTEWLAPRAQVEAREGGAFELFWGDDPDVDSTRGCRMLRLVPPRSLAFEWRGKSEFDPLFEPPLGPTEVLVRLEGEGGGTVLILEQAETRALEGWKAYDAWMAETWEGALAELKRLCERHTLG